MAEEFEPRRAEAGQEFTYTTTEDVTLAKDDEIPPGVEIIEVDPETGNRTGRRFGVQRTLKADAEGVVHPKTALDVTTLDAFDLPVARKAIAAAAAEKKGN